MAARMASNGTGAIMAWAAIALEHNAGIQCGGRSNRTRAIRARVAIVVHAIVAGAAIAPDRQSIVTTPWHRSGKPRHTGASAIGMIVALSCAPK